MIELWTHRRVGVPQAPGTGPPAPSDDEGKAALALGTWGRAGTVLHLPPLAARGWEPEPTCVLWAPSPAVSRFLPQQKGQPPPPYSSPLVGLSMRPLSRRARADPTLRGNCPHCSGPAPSALLSSGVLTLSKPQSPLYSLSTEGLIPRTTTLTAPWPVPGAHTLPGHWCLSPSVTAQVEPSQLAPRSTANAKLLTLRLSA